MHATADIDAIRTRFPYLATGRIWLNHAATAPWSTDVMAMLDRLRAITAHGEIDCYHDAMDVLTRTRIMAARMMGADARDVAFTPNTSEGLNLLASGLAWKPGDRIVLVDREFPSNIYPFLNLERLGVEIDFVPQTDGCVPVEAIECALTPRTVLVAVSWVQFLSGYTIDLEVLGTICRARGVLLSVDAIQGLGAIRLDLARTPVDFLSAGTQKWQMGPLGLAVVVVPPATRERITQSHLGWLSVDESWDFFDYRTDLLDDARRYEYGTFNAMGVYAYHGALSLFEEVGHDEIDRRVRTLSTRVFERAHELGCALLTPADPARRAGIVTFAHDEAERIAAALHERRIDVSARAGHVRIAPHFYNTDDEVDAAMAAIAELLH